MRVFSGTQCICKWYSESLYNSIRSRLVPTWGSTDHILTFDLDLQSQASYGHNPYRCKKVKSKVTRFRITVKTNEWTDKRTDGAQRNTFLVNTVCNCKQKAQLRKKWNSQTTNSVKQTAGCLFSTCTVLQQDSQSFGWKKFPEISSLVPEFSMCFRSQLQQQMTAVIDDKC